jgi:hypothetical protein
MNNYLYSLAFGVGAYLFYRLHKHWLIVRKQRQDYELVTKIKGINDWILIVMLVIASIVCLFKG